MGVAVGASHVRTNWLGLGLDTLRLRIAPAGSWASAGLVRTVAAKIAAVTMRTNAPESRLTRGPVNPVMLPLAFPINLQSFLSGYICHPCYGQFHNMPLLRTYANDG